MKNIVPGIGLVIFCAQVSAAQPPFQTMIDCELAGSQHTISLLRGSPIIDSYIYKTRYGQITRFIYDDAEASRGSEVQWQCASDQKNTNVLVVSGEFTSNYLQGALFYFDSTDGKIQRIDFAERNRPSWIKISAQGAQVIFENTGNESSHKYLSYGKNGLPLELDEFPVISKGESLIQLHASKP
ncbi:MULTISPECIES: hypothetical protein [unclassified Pseudomonas]|uniref:hypothetical protein n=1 Tax=unclassified Pseudomonas TaxID=196821 RepID=UPI001CC1B861|nr:MULTISPECIES: hypothetical protein [unclassified Pseudomonas]